MARLLVVLALVSAAPTVAHAQRQGAFLPRVGGSPEISASTQNQLEGVVIEELEVSGWSIQRRGSVSQGLPHRLRGCLPGDECELEVLDNLGVELLVSMAVWGQPDDPDAPGRIIVILMGLDGVPFRGQAEVLGETDDAVREAVRDALAVRARGAGPFILVVGGPEGAVCDLEDGQQHDLPATFRVTPGTHRISVHLDGYETIEREVVVPADATHVERVEVTLTSTILGIDVEPVIDRGLTMATNVALGLTAALGGLVPLAFGIASVVNDGDCTTFVGPNCVERSSVNAGTWTLLLGGSAMVIGGLLWAILQPIQIGVAASPDGAAVSVSGPLPSL